MFDFIGDMKVYQEQLDAAGIDFDISLLAGLTKSEIEGVVDRLMAVHAEVRETA